ncbi:MAG: 3'(2'),5'-bisphosphate nucleotidase CysQ [Bacteroidales bacterium]|jgi:3'(2'), 5'-bisphosphate nucleotidase|nr:3'(2'),5'-bisphosphate nucleotidase CysQ [Bacteroidales bacterium]MDI9593005.1 3'(2'),5'-bisphosphate nucleotidase CysQ [Bacteroidota bacterium]HOF81454.1 3'(2'),5'-bisphosphate nucleotidase CysQ [Bacteroidales bacterium]HOR76741.1 3'(2'),5'-bisphosphate nucleotidase CysQ [Bacteroidales bacterium]HPL12127.1 3'(2'),5'-bisphosphate nucleotidase CysQ [Bacteroidales bacterium]
MEKLLDTAILAAIFAGQELMINYNKTLSIDFKKDQSPVTNADRSAHALIKTALQYFDIPLLSEEGEHLSYRIRKKWEKLWIVDPLDGTKEYIKRNDEFTVNIAFIENNQPIIGVIYAPALQLLYFASKHLNKAFKHELKGGFTNLNELYYQAIELPINAHLKTNPIVLASRSHLDLGTKGYIDSINKRCGKINLVSVGSSLKFGLIAEGSALLYPRFSSTYEWDTAAGQAIIEMAGGSVINADDGSPLIYNKKDLLNPHFITRSAFARSGLI